MCTGEILELCQQVHAGSLGIQKDWDPGCLFSHFLVIKHSSYLWMIVWCKPIHRAYNKGLKTLRLTMDLLRDWPILYLSVCNGCPHVLVSRDIWSGGISMLYVWLEINFAPVAILIQYWLSSLNFQINLGF